MPHIDLPPAEQKALLKEALHEWLDAQYAVIGRSIVKAAATLIVGALALWAINYGHLVR